MVPGIQTRPPDITIGACHSVETYYFFFKLLLKLPFQDLHADLRASSLPHAGESGEENAVGSRVKVRTVSPSPSLY